MAPPSATQKLQKNESVYAGDDHKHDLVSFLAWQAHHWIWARGANVTSLDALHVDTQAVLRPPTSSGGLVPWNMVSELISMHQRHRAVFSTAAKTQSHNLGFDRDKYIA